MLARLARAADRSPMRCALRTYRLMTPRLRRRYRHSKRAVARACDAFATEHATAVRAEEPRTARRKYCEPMRREPTSTRSCASSRPAPITSPWTLGIFRRLRARPRTARCGCRSSVRRTSSGYSVLSIAADGRTCSTCAPRRAMGAGPGPAHAAGPAADRRAGTARSADVHWRDARPCTNPQRDQTTTRILVSAGSAAAILLPPPTAGRRRDRDGEGADGTDDINTMPPRQDPALAQREAAPALTRRAAR